MTCIYTHTHIYIYIYVVLFTFQTLNLLSVETALYMIIRLVHQTRTCSLATIGRFKFMDNTAITDPC